MFILSSYISIGRFTFDYVNDVEIVSTWENLTDTCKLTFPKKIKWFGSQDRYSKMITAGDNSLFKRLDDVSVTLGYNGVLKERFKGQVLKIHTKKPLEFECEDQMFKLKQVTIKSYVKGPSDKLTLRKLLTDVLPAGVRFTCIDLTLNDFKIENASVAEILDYLKRSFGLSCFFKNNILSVGFAYNVDAIASGTQIPVFRFYENIIDGNDLDYIRDDDVAIKIHAVSITSSRSPVAKIERDYGDLSGETRTLHFYNVTEPELAKLANEALSKLKYAGFRGSFETFLEPRVQHGDLIRLVDPEIPDRNGNYLVRKVVTKFGVDVGGRQIITLDRKV
jgi:hypothetical protein